MTSESLAAALRLVYRKSLGVVTTSTGIAFDPCIFNIFKLHYTSSNYAFLRRVVIFFESHYPNSSLHGSASDVYSFGMSLGMTFGSKDFNSNNDYEWIDKLRQYG